MRRFLRINLSLVLTLSFAGLLTSSCKDSSGKKDNLIDSLRQSLQNSNAVINSSTNERFHKLVNKASEPEMRERAKIWKPKAEHVLKTSATLMNYINELINTGKIDQSIAKDLLKKLLIYRTELLGIEEKVRYEFEHSILQTISTYDTSEKSTNKFYADYFASGDKYNHAVFNRFQNDVRIAENKIVTFCNEQVGIMSTILYSIYPMVSQNTTVLSPGQKLEITAGIGYHSGASNTTIIINGNSKQPNDSGFVRYKVTAPGKEGNYKIPVIINYTDYYSGESKTEQSIINYTVTKPCDQ